MQKKLQPHQENHNWLQNSVLNTTLCMLHQECDFINAGVQKKIRWQHLLKVYWVVKLIPFVKGKAKCLCKQPSSFFAGGKGPFPLG